MLSVTLPDWFTPDNLRTITVVVGVVALLLVIAVVRFVQKLVLKVAFAGLLALVAAGAWYSRADLADCARTCDCRVLGMDVEIPRDKNPACDTDAAGEAADDVG